MDKKIIFGFIVISLFLVSGCEGGGFFGDSKDKRPMTDADVRKGVQGLTMDFVQNAPPERIFQKTPFPIVVNLKNMGAFDIEDDKETPDKFEGGILVFGFEKAYVGVATDNDKAKQEFDIEGRSIYNPGGDVEFREVNAKTGEIGAQSETQPSTILATACYPYQTILGTSVCVDPEIYDIGKGQKACVVKDLVFAEGQGAPVTITKIETRMFPDDTNKVTPHFIIYIANKGNGEVINLNKVETACSSEALDYEDFNAISLIVSLSDKNLNCNVGGVASESTEIRLRGKEDMVRCTLSEGVDIGRDAYMTPLKIELNYGYTFTISKSIIIEKVLTH